MEKFLTEVQARDLVNEVKGEFVDNKLKQKYIDKNIWYLGSREGIDYFVDNSQTSVVE